jgi:hypothetical protein
MTERWRDEWAEKRAGGMRHFVWSHGVLRWGGFMCLLSLGAFQQAHFGHLFSREGHWGLRLLVALLTWAFVGYLYGCSQWRRNERRFGREH